MIALPLPKFTAHFLRLAAANILSNLMVPLAGLIDTAFLGHLNDIRHLAGVALATVIFNVLYHSLGFLRMGTTGLTAQARGRGEDDEVWRVALRNGSLALGLGLLILLLQGPIRTVGFALLPAEAAVQVAGAAFYNTRIWGAPAVLLNLVLLGWFLGQGQGRRLILLSALGNGANIGLDYLFIRQWGWASAGAGAATALSQYAVLLVGLNWVLRDGGWGRLSRLLPQLRDYTALRGLLQLNRDILIRTLALVASFALFTQFSARLGTPVLTANTLLLQVISLTAYFVDGIAFATESLAGQFHGSGERQHLRWLLGLGGTLSVAIGIGIALGFSLWPIPLFGLLTGHGDVVARVGHYVWWLLPSLGLGAIAYLLDGYFLGLTAGKALRNSSLLAAAVGFLPSALLAQHLDSPHLLWLAFTLFMAGRATTLARLVPSTLTSLDTIETFGELK
ncbi:DNA damage-inducible protein F [Halomicronema hongdechloris C2206]|uniref:DNA damage-inducible protein F n=1 Tax=Halomicronema hongdechloris C2206 TaxID=1641165 RepID=A0A1Z3HUV4_9CYAN|nr:MATE family efflux transporter [Halomicronema hongdechloris]ASC73907.1 DNA damage-inducible protein F [Halomicronema hongdechloris C2206]